MGSKNEYLFPINGVVVALRRLYNTRICLRVDGYVVEPMISYEAGYGLNLCNVENRVLISNANPPYLFASLVEVVKVFVVSLPYFIVEFFAVPFDRKYIHLTKLLELKCERQAFCCNYLNILIKLPKTKSTEENHKRIHFCLECDARESAPAD